MQVLEGIKVLDLSKWLPGQYCGMVLGDFGADVIKIEDMQGDATRGFCPEQQAGMSYWHLALNRNKRGLVVDLKTETGRAVLHKLIREADVFLEGFRPGYLARYGLDYASVQASNPQLIYCSITGFGQKSKFNYKPAHDLNIIGLAGLNSLDDVGTACFSDMQISALGGSMNAVSGILLALLARAKTGVGQAIDIDLYSTALGLQATAISALWGSRATGTPVFGRTAHYYNIYKVKDGRYLSVGTIEPKFWTRFCQLIGLDSLATRQFDFEHEAEIQKEVAKVLLEKTQAEWLKIIGAEEFCVTPICSLEEAIDSEISKEAQMFEQRQEDLGNLNYLKTAIKLSTTPGQIERRAPHLGEHTVEILKEYGYNEKEINALVASGVIKKMEGN